MRLSESQIARAGIGRKFQKPTVFEDQSVWANLSMALRNKRGPFGDAVKETPQDAVRIAELADEIGLSDRLADRAGDLSHGQKQWLENRDAAGAGAAPVAGG